MKAINILVAVGAMTAMVSNIHAFPRDAIAKRTIELCSCNQNPEDSHHGDWTYDFVAASFLSRLG